MSSNDLVTRLRNRIHDSPMHNEHLMDEAIDHITTLEAEIEVLREALRPFADCMEYIDDDEDDDEWAKFRLVVKNYRDARDALKGHKG